MQHHSALAHHFDTLEQQKEAATLGMWGFLMTELMLFGGIFMGYIAYRWAYPEIFVEASHHLNMLLGTINTVVLLVSSLTVALAVHSAEQGKTRRVVALLLVTIVLGVTFLGIKGVEYGEKFIHCFEPGTTECLVPGPNFLYPTEELHAATGAAHGAVAAAGAAGLTPEQQVAAQQAQQEPGVREFQLFFLLYFFGTGLHAIHMIIGITVIGVIAFMTVRGRFSSEYYTPVEMGGLYWHLIDIIWVFLFPLFYLIH